MKGLLPCVAAPDSLTGPSRTDEVPRTNGARSSGHTIQIASIGGRIGPPGSGAYSAAKWGVEGFPEE